MKSSKSLIGILVLAASAALTGCPCHECPPPKTDEETVPPGGPTGIPFADCAPTETANCKQSVLDGSGLDANVLACTIASTLCQNNGGTTPYTCRANLKTGKQCITGQTATCKKDLTHTGTATCIGCIWGDCV
jgi:hypothetical protein